LHSGWLHGYWGGWYTRPWLWFGGGTGAGWLLSDLYADYFNPYYARALDSVYDYGAPIPVPDSALVDDSNLEDEAADPNAANAAQLMEASRQAFLALDYAKAQSLIDQAVSLLPSDATLHQFRALVLFARGMYQDAAAVVYDVLAVGPGWDWPTLRSFYPDTATYEKQLRKLEAFATAHPEDAASRLLLAYQYLVIGDQNSGAKMLQSVVKLQPKDELAAHLLGMLQKQTNPDRPRASP